MVSGARTEGHISARVSKTIQSIKEIVGNHSDDDIYVALKEANMDPNETAQKLLHQDTFHVVRRKRDRKKESIVEHQVSVDPRKISENVAQGMRFRTYPERGSRRGGYTRNVLPGNAVVNREFRVVRDNRVNQNANKDTKPPLSQCSTSLNDQVPMNVADKGSTGTPNNQRFFSSQSSSQTSNAPSSSHVRHVRDANSGGVSRKEISEEKRTFIPNAASQSQAVNPNNIQAHSGTQSSSSSVVGVYSSSTDPVHVPSPDSRSSGAVGAIKREVGVVGVRRHLPEDAGKDSSETNTHSNSLVGRDTSSEAFRPFPAISRADREVRDTHSSAAESAISGISGSRSFVSNPYGSRQHQQVLVHQKANQHNKEWKPKSSQKSSVNNPRVIGTPKKSASPADDAKDLDSETAKLQEKLSHVNIHENENVIIAQHIRVPENDRHRLTFGSFGVENDSSRNLVPGFHATGVAGDSNGESAPSLPVSSPDTSSDDTAAGKPINILDDQLGNSGSDSPPSGTASEHQLPDKKDAPSPQNLDSYADIGMVQDNSQSYAPSEPQQQQDPPELPGFSAYDPQTGYDLPYFRPSVDETARGQGLLSPQEALSMHVANTTASTIPMMQQQQPPVAQMYPQVHMPHFANLMPYRQFVSPIYLPQMAVPGYSSNPAFPHPSNGSNYLLMPGGSTHIGANGVKYGIQQFKPVPAGNPTGFGNFTGPSGYAINAPGVVGSATGLEDSSRTKYKDGNIYVQNQQGDTSDLWMQNPRELPNMQSAAYYNMPQTPHGYMPSHTGHASFNAAAAAQSSHMQFSGLYHPPPQPAAMANPHHLNPAMGANVGFGVAPAAPGAQVGAYQQPQLGHLNRTSNF
ncbi:hypothetical protein V6N13_132682 [Hibiscus sabdariffa]|uniref:GBF-interacting protein 1 N-terminal domain-containing protein n=1 Tax=Hibiscus sabdariffa TaxID=183260 RepID=A0ABR2PW49_9ROSI